MNFDNLTKTKINAMRVSDLDAYLSHGGIEKSDLEKMNRTAKVKKAQEIFSSDNSTNIIEQIETVEAEPDPTPILWSSETEETTPENTETPSEQQKLDHTSEEWTAYILSQLRENEIIEGYPTAPGLRRLFHKMFNVISSEVNVVQAPEPPDRRATVVYKISYQTNDGTFKTISDVADCYYGNSKKPFSYHPTATASTMAEGRALRKALHLNIEVQEEMNMPEGEERELADFQDEQMPSVENQHNVIRGICKRLHIDLEKLLSKNSLGTRVEDILFGDARKMLQLLTSYQRTVEEGGTAIPEEILIND